MSSTIVALLIGALMALPQPHEADDAPPPMTVHLIELPPASVPAPQAVSPELPAPDAQAEPDVAPMPPEEPAEAVTPVTTELAPVFAPLPTALVLPSPPAPAIPRAPRPLPRPPRHPSASPRTAMTAGLTAPPLASSPAIRAQQPPTPASPPDTTSGIGPYRAGLHAQIERNMSAGTEIEPAAAGTTLIEAVIASDGGVISARIAHGSGNRAVDHAALAAVQRGGYRRFGTHMPEQPITISVPITIAPD